MKKSIVVFMVVFALLAVAQQPATSAPAASGQPASQQKTIKDPAEYNAYVNAMKTTDPNQKAIQLEGFLQQYPNSVMKEDALDLLMKAYQQAGNVPKMVDAAKRLLQVNPKNLTALALLTYLDRMNANMQTGPQAAQQATQLLAEAAQYGQQGIAGLQTATKPEGMSDADWENFKKQVAPIFYGAVGQNALGAKDYATAQKNLQEAVNANPNDMANVYPLATSYLESNPVNPLGFWYIAHAASLAVAQAQPQYQAQAQQQQQQLLRYGKSRYVRFHGGDDGWKEIVDQAAAQATPPAGFAVKPAPTPAEQAAILAQQKPVNQMSFDEIQLILTSGNQEAADKVWADLKDKPTSFQAKVITAAATKLGLAATYDDGQNKVIDVELTMAAPLPARFIPKVESDATVTGVPVSYTAKPFMIIMTKGTLVGKEPVEPKKPATAKPGAGKPATHRPTH